MDWNCMEGNWKQTAGKIKEKWGKLPTMISHKSTVSVNNSREKSRSATALPRIR